jgi:ribosomal protein S18 acetylase RimI-like enzyme
VRTGLRRISPGDLAVYREIRLRALKDAPSAFGSTYARESAFTDREWTERVERLEGETGVGFLAVDDDAACGLVVGFLDREDPKRAGIVSMWVAPAHRRAGVGRSLVEAVLDWASQRGAGTVRLMVTSANEGAMRFYEDFGFERTGVVRPHAHLSSLTEIELERPVTRTDRR